MEGFTKVSGARGTGTARSPATLPESSGGIDTPFERPQPPRSPRGFSKLVPSPATRAEMKKPQFLLTRRNVDKFDAKREGEEARMLHLHSSDIRLAEWLKNVPLCLECPAFLV